MFKWVPVAPSPILPSSPSLFVFCLLCSVYDRSSLGECVFREKDVCEGHPVFFFLFCGAAIGGAVPRERESSLFWRAIYYSPSSIYYVGILRGGRDATKTTPNLDRHFKLPGAGSALIHCPILYLLGILSMCSS